jgi:hypothetical protein
MCNLYYASPNAFLHDLYVHYYKDESTSSENERKRSSCSRKY